MPWAKIRASPKRVAATTAAHFVGRLAHIRDMSCTTLRVINPFWLATHTWFMMLQALNVLQGEFQCGMRIDCAQQAASVEQIVPVQQEPRAPGA